MVLPTGHKKWNWDQASQSWVVLALYRPLIFRPFLEFRHQKTNWNRPTPYLFALDFRILDFGVYFKLGKKSSSKPTWFFFEFELDFYCLCSLQKSISKSNWFFSFLNLIFWNWKKFEWHSISQKSSGDRQGDCCSGFF